MDNNRYPQPPLNPTRPPSPGRPTRRRSALFRRTALDQQQPLAERMAALAIWLVSLSGSLLFGGGGLEAWLTRAPNAIGATVALVMQLLLSYYQYVYGRTRPPIYWILIVVSSALTLLGWWPLLMPPLTSLVLWAVPPLDVYAAWVAGALLVIAALVVDVVPEQVLID